MLCLAHSALIGQQLSASHVLLQLSNLCQAFSKIFKVLNTCAFSIRPASRGLLRDYEPSDATFWSTNGDHDVDTVDIVTRE